MTTDRKDLPTGKLGVGSFDDPAFTLAQRILAHPLDASLFQSLNASEDD